MVRSAIRPEGVNNTCGSGSEDAGAGNVVTTASTAETEETEVCSTQQRPSLPISSSSPTFSNVKETIQRAVSGSPPPPYEAVAVDIDKEEEALRSGVERAALVLNSRLEPACAASMLLKNDSMDSNGTTSDELTSACTTQPL